MNMNIREATADEIDFAWTLYKKFISNHIFPLCKTADSLDSWCAKEKKKFEERWPSRQNMIVEKNNLPAAWVGIRKRNNTIHIGNYFAADELGAGKIFQLFFEQATSSWKAEKRLVNVIVSNDHPNSSTIAEILSKLGFSPLQNDGMSQMFVADWVSAGA